MSAGVRTLGLVLAGGMGRRMGGRDKGLVHYLGRPLVEHVLERLVPQVDAVAINANRSLDEYAAFGHPVIRDRLEGFHGPLAGMSAGLEAAAARGAQGIVTVPCDAPALPKDLAQRLLAAAGPAERGAVAAAGGRLQPVFAWVPVGAAASLEDWLSRGERKIDRWFEREDFAVAAFDDPEAFRNLNAPADLEPPASSASLR